MTSFVAPVRAVLVAAANASRLRPILASLARDYRIDLVGDGRTAAETLARGGHVAAMITTDLPGMSGLDALRRLAALRLRPRPLILAVGEAGDVRLNVIATHGLADAVQPLPCAEAILLRQLWGLLDREVEARWTALPSAQRELIQATRHLLSDAADAVRAGQGLPAAAADQGGRQIVEALNGNLLGPVLGGLQAHHDYSLAHSVRVAAHLGAFALATGMRQSDAMLLAQAGLLHDIGKTGVPVAILDKPGPLDSPEWGVMRRHTLMGAEVLRRTTELPPQVVAIAERHHERLDGSGYPHGLAGAEIDEPSLLCAIADVHTALTDRRAYRAAMSDAEAFAKMREMAGPQLDAGLLRIYEQVIRDGLAAPIPLAPPAALSPASAA